MPERIHPNETIGSKITTLEGLWNQYFASSSPQPDALKTDLNKALVEMLNLRGAESALLRASAAAVRDQRVGHEIKVRGIVELSNVCRADCDYCPIRKSNLTKDKIRRLRKEEMVDAMRDIHSAGIREVFIQSGEDAQIFRSLMPTLDTVHADPELKEMKIIANLGDLLRPEQYAELASHGVNGYVMNFETSNVAMHEALRPHSTFEERIGHMRLITQSNLEFGTGFVLGFPGQTDDDVANDIRFIRESGATKMVSVSCFTPGEETPLAGAEAGNFDKTLNAIAILRILFPDAQIPAPSNSDSPKIVRSDATGKSGLTLAIESGANEVTVNYTPERVRENYPIYDVAAKRPKVFLENALRISQETGMPLKIAETFDMPASIEHQYDEIGAMYVAEKRRFFSAIPDPGQKYILEHLKDVAGKDAVDVGCGGGDDMAVYRGLGFKSVVGVDPSKVMVAEAKKHLGDENAAVLGSWMNLPFENESKDYLIGRYSLQYAENLDTAFTEAARVLKLGGGLLLVVPFPRDYKNTFEKDGKKFVRTVLYDQKVPVVNPLHTMEEYLSPTFLSLFDVVDKGEYIGPEREDTSGKPDGMLLYARKK